MTDTESRVLTIRNDLVAWWYRVVLPWASGLGVARDMDREDTIVQKLKGCETQEALEIWNKDMHIYVLGLEKAKNRAVA